jgi:uncharacterized protein (DUF2267 family)
MAANPTIDPIRLVELQEGLSREQAERAISATLATLAERITGGEARDLAEQLPDPLGRALSDGEPAEPFDADEFVRRVAQREGVSEDEAFRHARAVFAALGRVIDRAEITDMAAQLPKDFAPFIRAAEQPVVASPPLPDVFPEQKFIELVAERTGLDEQRARRAAEAVLELLAKRISGGQAEDVAPWLPGELRTVFDRAAREHGEQPLTLSADEFLAGVAAREGASVDEAFEHTRAVFTALRRALPQKEFTDTLAQLPREYTRQFVEP